MAAGHHFNRLAAQRLELGEQRKFLVGGKLVARWMGDHGNAAALFDPRHRLAQAGPFVLDVAGLAFGQVFSKHFICIFANAGFDQIAAKVGAGDQIGVAHVFQGALERVFDADLSQPVRHLYRPLAPPAPGFDQASQHIDVVGVKAQTHDMYRRANEADRNFCARYVAHAVGLGGCGGTVLPADLVMVGQRPQFNAIFGGALSQSFGGEGAV